MASDAMDAVNRTPLAEFIRKYMTALTWVDPRTRQPYEIAVTTADDLSAADFEACFALLQATSMHDYKHSSLGWKPRSKRREMQLRELKYLLVKAQDQLTGFASFMPTIEDDAPVVYCYEIHLSPSLQGTGLGTVLMDAIYAAGTRISIVEKIMLTCFVRNQRGIRFYRKLGFATDDFSPPARRLRNGTVIEPDYVILSKRIER